MSALAEALLAAQRQAVGALCKAYVAGLLSDEGFSEELDKLGLRDEVDQGLIIQSLYVIRAYGASAPSAPRASDAPKMISDGQKPYIRDLFRKKNIEPLSDIDLDALPYTKASALIEALKAGTYNADDYVIPF